MIHETCASGEELVDRLGYIRHKIPLCTPSQEMRWQLTVLTNTRLHAVSVIRSVTLHVIRLPGARRGLVWIHDRGSPGRTRPSPTTLVYRFLAENWRVHRVR